MSDLRIDRSPAADPLPLSPSSMVWPLRRQLTFVTAAWMCGSIWSNVVSGASITAFARGLGATHFQFGLLAAIPFIAALFAVPGSLLVERTGERKRLFLELFLIQRLICLAVAAGPILILYCYGRTALPHAMSLALCLLFLLHSTGAAGGPAWVSWMADVVPQRVRGAYFARRRQWGIVTAIPAAVLIGWMLNKLAGPMVGPTPASAALASADHPTPLQGVPTAVFWGAVILAGSTVLGLADILLFAPLPHTAKPRQRGSGLLKAMLVPLKDRPFMTFSTFVGVTNFTVGFTNQFATVFVMERLNLDYMHAGLMLVATPMLVQWLILPAWGAAVDRMGRKPLIVLAGIGLVPMAFGWILMGQAPGMHWMGYLLFAGGTALWTGIEVANFNCVIDSGDRKPGDGTGVNGGSAYHAVNTVVINLAGCGGGLAAGLIAKSLGDWSWKPVGTLNPFNFYDALFTFSGVVRLAALVVLARLLIEPAAKPLGVTLRFLMTYTANHFMTQMGAVAGLVRRPRSPVEPDLPPALAGTIAHDDPATQIRPAA